MRHTNTDYLPIKEHIFSNTFVLLYPNGTRHGVFGWFVGACLLSLTPAEAKDQSTEGQDDGQSHHCFALPEISRRSTPSDGHVSELLLALLWATAAVLLLALDRCGQRPGRAAAASCGALLLFSRQ